MASDEELVAALAGGDERAFEELVVRYRQRLFAFVYRHTGGPDADDIVQETWMRILRAAGSFDSRKRFTTWLFQVALNLCRDFGRRRRVRGPEAESGCNGEEQDVESEASSVMVEDAAAARIDAERFLARLPEEQREVLILRFHADLSEHEIADLLGCPPGTVKSRIHYALARLAKAAAASGDGSRVDRAKKS